MSTSLKEVLKTSTVSREQVIEARAEEKRRTMVVELEREKAKTGESLPGRIQYLQHLIAVAIRHRENLENSYDAPRKAFLKANRDEHAAAVAKQGTVLKRLADLERGASLVEISIVEASEFQKLVDQLVASETDSGLTPYLTKWATSSEKKLSELEADQQAKRAEAKSLKAQLPRLQQKLDDLIAALAI